MNKEQNTENKDLTATFSNTVLGDVELSALETKWLDRLKKYLSDYKYEYVISWWLRCEYEHEGITTPKINYILTKLVTKGILKKETTRSYTKFSLNFA